MEIRNDSQKSKTQKRKPLHNIYDKEALRKRLDSEAFRRITLSFYRYVILEDVKSLRDRLYEEWESLGVLGRIYVAREGINAQISVPSPNMELFRANLESRAVFKNMPFKIAVEDDGKSFLKLDLKVRKKIVADGLDDDSFDVTNVGNHLGAEEFNRHLEDKNTIVVDVRNHYESEIGHFENALLPQSDTFREELRLLLELLQGKEDNKILMYCTGGIRCEKASAWLKHHGYKDVNQLHGGIISYAHEVAEKGLESKFKGKNFVFDGRLQETIGEEIISTCHQCGSKSDRHVNCANPGCHILFIQCETCTAAFDGCCTEECKSVLHLPADKQKEIRKGKANENRFFTKSRIRPKVSDLYRIQKGSESA
ncbi:rhodanese-related sulfurtransferase [Leptospira gomenensis]|uniref:tRNA uridine(34) hydroxylase n=1 Tax=Leptospira gomenensis TaxID=2484974 RepID=A0A5F1YLQ8_9LEPT|nr:rhodanese-related sulfurtransferase [Leptospira gomenensis]TGK36394.1 rhodanese-related sulfurtransferase [Leptospira gomenensis]TGK42038.1 rhodanese-related sulfurtransferase [Leptospira gomenensis]TGK48893.1 rhodanese-related sulfurtransferase [Leptospira gomenensis]TGK58018.1 rhodanese-related sulfurtransferase [Leptospira gomenensis]